MIRILDSLILRQFTRLFLISIFATPPLFILAELTEDLDLYVDRGLTSFQVAHGLFYRLPEYIVWSFPVAALIATVFTIHAMTMHSEIVAAKAGGVSFHRLFVPIGLMAIVLTGAALALTEVAPRSNKISSQILENQDPRREFRSDFVYQTEGGLTVSARRLTVSERRLQRVVLQRPPGQDEPSLHVEADMASHDSIQGWTFEHGYLRVVEDEGQLVSMAFETMQMPGFTERPDELLETPPEDEEMTYAEIDRLASIIQRSGGQPHELLVKKEQKLAIPAATLVIVLFGAPLATSSNRGGTTFGIGVALGTTILYLGMLKVTGAFGASGALPPWPAAWIPNGFFLLAGTVLMIRVRT